MRQIGRFTVTAVFLSTALGIALSDAWARQEVEHREEVPKVKKVGSTNPKMESELDALVRAFKAGNSDEVRRLAKRLPLAPKQDSVTVVLVLDSEVDDQVVSAVRALGADVQVAVMRLIQASVPISLLEELSRQPYIRYIRMPWRVYPNAVSSGGTGFRCPGLIGVSQYHTKGYKGQGVKVGIIGGDLEHGNLLRRVVRDIAPEADVYLTTEETVVELIDHILGMEGRCHVGVSGSSILPNPGDGRGPLCEAIDRVRRNGVLFVQAAGNYAQRHYEGRFRDTDRDGWHEFSPGDEGLSFYAEAGDVIDALLMWNDWNYDDPNVGTSTHDYDLYLKDRYNNTIASSTKYQNGNDLPYEHILCVAPRSGLYSLRVKKYRSSTNCILEIYNFNHDILEDEVVTSGSIAPPADARGALAVGAVDCGDVLEPYSSRGPTNAVWRACCSMMADPSRTKPDLVAPDEFVISPTEIWGGTSCSAAVVAGAAAVYLSANPNLKGHPDLLQARLEEHAKDLGTSGKDDMYGAGRINLPPISKPDLMVESVEAPDQATQGSSIAVRSVIANRGLGSAGRFVVKFYLSTNTMITKYDTYLGSKTVVGLPAGGTASLSAYVKVPTTVSPGVYYLGVVADADRQVAESREDNNTGYDRMEVVRPVRPSISHLKPSSGPVGTRVTITGTNFGSTRGTSYVTFYPDRRATRYIVWSDTRIVVEVPSGARTGDVYVRTSEGRSNGKPFTVAPPNLKVTSLTVSPQDLPEGGRVTISWSAQNVGRGAAPSWFVTSLYVDFKKVKSWYRPPNLEPGERYSGTYATDLAAGQHIVWVITDSYFRVPETDEEDNVMFAIISPQPIPAKVASGVPKTYGLGQNHPNPFNAETRIRYELPRPSHVVLEVFDVLGHKVRTLMNSFLPSGTYEQVWDGRGDDGSPVASGVYFYRLKAGDFVDMKKMLLLR